MFGLVFLHSQTDTSVNVKWGFVLIYPVLMAANAASGRHRWPEPQSYRHLSYWRRCCSWSIYFLNLKNVLERCRIDACLGLILTEYKTVAFEVRLHLVPRVNGTVLCVNLPQLCFWFWTPTVFIKNVRLFYSSLFEVCWARNWRSFWSRRRGRGVWMLCAPGYGYCEICAWTPAPEGCGLDSSTTNPRPGDTNLGTRKVAPRRGVAASDTRWTG